MFKSSAVRKTDIMRAEIQRIESLSLMNAWSLDEKVAISCRVLAMEGHCNDLSGQISAKKSNGGYLTQSLGVGFDEVSVSNLLVVNRDLEVLLGDGIPNPANRFHSWVYEKRSDVGCIIHMHSKFASIMAMLNADVQVAHMDTSCLFGKIRYLRSWPGIPVGNDEGEIITNALGDGKVLLLANHGYVVVGECIEEALIYALRFELACELSYRAKLVGEVSDICSGLAEEARVWTTTPKRLEAHFAYQARKVLRADLSCLD